MYIENIEKPSIVDRESVFIKWFYQLLTLKWVVLVVQCVGKESGLDKMEIFISGGELSLSLWLPKTLL